MATRVAALRAALRAALAAAAVAVARAAVGAAAGAVPTCTRHRWCNSCAGRGADTGRCLLCVCYKMRPVWAALAELCR